jgi:peptidoglycan/xylan/chitin deacetylase (PgdA/CDA1 family)
MTQSVPILVYHHVYPDRAPELNVSGEQSAGILSASALRQQIECLLAAGWDNVSTTQIVDWLEGKGELPARAFALHFDNGWLDTHDTALEVTDSCGVQATCFPITDGVEAATAGGSAAVRTLTEGVVEKPFMTWEQVAALIEHGWEIGAHTATHCKVADSHESFGDDAIITEAETSNRLFEQRLGMVPEHFAYPSGSRNDRTDELLSRFYRSLRLWHFEQPIEWTFTQRNTSTLAVDCQNIDIRVPFEEFERLLKAANTA